MTLGSWTGSHRLCCACVAPAHTPSVPGCPSPQFFLKATQLHELRQEYDGAAVTVESVEERIRQAQPHVDAVKQKFKVVKTKYQQFQAVCTGDAVGWRCVGLANSPSRPWVLLAVPTLPARRRGKPLRRHPERHPVA